MKRAWFLGLIAAVPFLRPLRGLDLTPNEALEVYDGGISGRFVPDPKYWPFKKRPWQAVCFGQYDTLPLADTVPELRAHIAAEKARQA